MQRRSTLSPIQGIILVAITAIASATGPAQAGVAEGKEAFDKGDYKTALQEFKKTPKDPKAMSWMGYLYLEGKGVKQDIKAAVSWIEKAANAGDDWAQYKYGMFLFAGSSGVKKDQAKAFQFLQKAADAGVVEAISPLGRLYRNGLGVIANQEKALELFKLGVEKDQLDAKFRLGYELFKGEITATDYPRARELFQDVFDKVNDEDSAFYLGYMYEQGLGGSKDYAKALRFYRVAAEAGNAAAQNNLGLMYWNGRGGMTDTTEASNWFKKAAANGNEKGRENLTALQQSIEEQKRRMAQRAAEQERAQAAKRRPGTMLCNSGSGTLKEYSGYLIMGKPHYNDVQGTTRVAAYVENSSPPKLSLRVARLEFIYPNGKTQNMDSLDSSWGQLAPNRVFWSDESSWDQCY